MMNPLHREDRKDVETVKLSWSSRVTLQPPVQYYRRSTTRRGRGTTDGLTSRTSRITTGRQDECLRRDRNRRGPRRGHTVSISHIERFRERTLHSLYPLERTGTSVRRRTTRSGNSAGERLTSRNSRITTDRHDQRLRSDGNSQKDVLRR